VLDGTTSLTLTPAALEPIRVVAFSPDGGTLALVGAHVAADADESWPIELWKLYGWEETFYQNEHTSVSLVGHSLALLFLQMHGTILASASMDHTIKL
jgi:WD40 repeat protein